MSWKSLGVSVGVALAIVAGGVGLRMTQAGDTARGQQVDFSPARGSTGATGPAGPSTVGSPNARTVVAGTAFQATDNTKPALVTVNLSSTAGLSLSGGTTNTAVLVIGSSSSIGSSGGTIVGSYSNSNTGSLTIGLGLNTIQGGPLYAFLPAGQWAAIRVTGGTVTITSAMDQSLG